MNRRQVLDMDGRRCRNKVVARIRYHGDNEIYGGISSVRPRWVIVDVCRKHAEGEPHLNRVAAQSTEEEAR